MRKTILFLIIVLVLTASANQRSRVSYLAPYDAHLAFNEAGQAYLDISGVYPSSCPGKVFVKYSGKKLMVYKVSTVTRNDMLYCSGEAPGGLIREARGCGCTPEFTRILVPVN